MDGNGTLLGDDGTTVSAHAREVLGKVQDLGIPCVLVTGRGLEKARPTLAHADLRDYVITENGARAIRVSDGVALSETWLEGSRAAEPIRRIREKLPGAFFAQLTADGGVVEASHPWLSLGGDDEATARRLFAHIVAQLEPALIGSDGDATGQPPRRCAKCYATVAETADFEADMAAMRSVVGEDWEVRQIKQLLPGGTKNTCEVQSSSVNKADGIAALCQAIGISMENVWAFGDDANDIRMLREVGWGVRMANYKPALEGVGDDVTRLTNKDDGLIAYLEEHLLASRSSDASGRAA